VTTGQNDGGFEELLDSGPLHCHDTAMPTENEYSLADLADLADVTPRTIRYYIAQGLLPSPGQAGPGARYSDGHLARLRLIKQLQRQHLPLAEIRRRLALLGDIEVHGLLEAPQDHRAAESAVEYIRGVLSHRASEGPTPLPMAAMAPSVNFSRDDVSPSTPAPSPDRSQWERVAVGPDIELHIRRPLDRLQNRRVERLITIARQVLEEDKP
jgi:DNA-binding transcriptional MerR regulator